MFHINIRNFHNNDRPNKIALTILSQLKITKVNIIENFGKENNRITSEIARILWVNWAWWTRPTVRAKPKAH